jgi:hypothetical protein
MRYSEFYILSLKFCSTNLMAILSSNLGFWNKTTNLEILRVLPFTVSPDSAQPEKPSELRLSKFIRFEFAIFRIRENFCSGRKKVLSVLV